MVKRWLPLESNPEVLNKFVQDLGCSAQEYQFCDVYGLDEELLAMVPQPVLALVLLFNPDCSKRTGAEQADSAMPSDLYYMKQTIRNACGTIGVLHAVLNNHAAMRFRPGSFLQRFYDATAALSPHERGKHLEDPPDDTFSIDAVHHAAAVTGQTAAPGIDEEVDFHFVALVEHDKTLYELDGSRGGPISHGPTTPATFLQDAVKVVRAYTQGGDSIRCNLIALAGRQH